MVVNITLKAPELLMHEKRGIANYAFFWGWCSKNSYCVKSLEEKICISYFHLVGLSVQECEAVVTVRCQEEVKGKQMRGIFQLQHHLAEE